MNKISNPIFIEKKVFLLSLLFFLMRFLMNSAICLSDYFVCLFIYLFCTDILKCMLINVTLNCCRQNFVVHLFFPCKYDLARHLNYYKILSQKFSKKKKIESCHNLFKALLLGSWQSKKCISRTAILYNNSEKII